MTRSPDFRPDVKPPWHCARVIKACRALTDGEKLVWLEILGLWNGPEGCYMGAGPLARRLGWSPDGIEKARRRLVTCGLLVSALSPGRRTASWWAILPEAVRPSATKPDDLEVEACAVRLAAIVEAAKGVQSAPHRPPVTSASRSLNGAPSGASPQQTGAQTGARSSGAGASLGVPPGADSASIGAPWGAPEVSNLGKSSEEHPTSEAGGAHARVGEEGQPPASRATADAAPVRIGEITGWRDVLRANGVDPRGES